MRCGVYVRVSTDDQRDNGYSIDSQLRMIKEYCEKNDWDYLAQYVWKYTSKNKKKDITVTNIWRWRKDGKQIIKRKKRQVVFKKKNEKKKNFISFNNAYYFRCIINYCNICMVYC